MKKLVIIILMFPIFGYCQVSIASNKLLFKTLNPNLLEISNPLNLKIIDVSGDGCEVFASGAPNNYLIKRNEEGYAFVKILFLKNKKDTGSHVVKVYFESNCNFQFYLEDTVTKNPPELPCDFITSKVMMLPIRFVNPHVVYPYNFSFSIIVERFNGELKKFKSTNEKIPVDFKEYITEYSKEIQSIIFCNIYFQPCYNVVKGPEFYYE